MTSHSTQMVASIVLDPTLQSRVGINEQKINEYAEILQEAEGQWPFPPVETVNAYLVDGWHRLLAAKRCSWTAVPVNQQLVQLSDDNPNAVRQEALRRACGANVTHGLPRSHEDKRRAVALLLEEFGELSDREISRQAGVSPTFVGRVRRERDGVSTWTPGPKSDSGPAVETSFAERSVAKSVAKEVNAENVASSAARDVAIDRMRMDQSPDTESLDVGMRPVVVEAKLKQRRQPKLEKPALGLVDSACTSLAELNRKVAELRGRIGEAEFSQARDVLKQLDGLLGRWASRFERMDSSDRQHEVTA